jgi:acetyltransferase-like isoleucine patch superfamily enzyme
VRQLDLFMALVTFPRRLRDWLYNIVFSALCGARVRIAWSEVRLMGTSRIRFGQRFVAGRGLWLQAIGNDARLTIGDDVNMSDWVHIGAARQVSIGNGCLIGSKVIITDHSHGTAADIALDAPLRPNARALHSKGSVVLEDNVWLGDGVAVLSGVTIGRNAVVGANSVVTRNIPSNTVWAGVPAKQLWPTHS